MVKLCECGCGQPAPIAKFSRKKVGHKKGEPVRFIKGHSLRIARPRNQPSGEAHTRWMGDQASVLALHKYITRHFPKAGVCEFCSARGRTDYALIAGRQYSRSREDYIELCKPCHHGYDSGTTRLRGADGRFVANDIPPVWRTYRQRQRKGGGAVEDSLAK